MKPFLLRFAASCLLLFPFLTAAQVKIICPPLSVKITKQVKPEYPKEAKEAGIEGKVDLRCMVRPDGTVEKIDVVSGKEPFVQAAQKAVAQWKYQPLVLNGVAIEFDTTVQVIFQLPKKLENRQTKTQS